jgi:hypothetical protein
MAYRDPITKRFAKAPEPVVEDFESEMRVKPPGVSSMTPYHVVGACIAIAIGLCGVAFLLLVANP